VLTPCSGAQQVRARWPKPNRLTSYLRLVVLWLGNLFRFAERDASVLQIEAYLAAGSAAVIA
jgi:hypothetical protein